MANKELNILVLGETGVGKSTWINSLLNYISFLTLDEAMKEKQLQMLIASSFIVTTTMGKKLVQQEIKVGESVNEDTAIGSSATQSTTPYVIHLDGCTIRLIDTPGIGDTRGTDQDQKNMEDILNTINHYDVLHGIVILLKPNNSRIGVMFRFVIQELLTHLHRSAAQNIVFGFTNTRQTHYQPGDTFPSLDKLLRKMASDLIELTTDTVYNFDSESFRFLAAHKQGVDLGNQIDYEKSWERSVEECIRMVSHIASLPPHPITNTVTLNASRKLITDLTKPMAEISRLITLNIQMNEEEANVLQETNASGAELLKKLKVKRIDLNQVSLSQPVTVCTNSNCIQVRSCGERQVTNYITRCHNPCYLSGVQTDTVNTAQLLQCAAMNGGNTCTNCSHSYVEHMHVLYYYEEVEREVDDESINDQITRKTNDAERKKVAIASREKLITEYRAEQEKIEKANAKFGFYLKQNSITPYNDARLAYLDHLIRQEENKLHASRIIGNNDYDEDIRKRTQEVIIALELSRCQYIEYEKILNDAMEHDGSSDDQPLQGPKDVYALVNSLYDLKHFGKSLRDNKDGIVHRHENAYRNNYLAEVKHPMKAGLSKKWKSLKFFADLF